MDDDLARRLAQAGVDPAAVTNAQAAFLRLVEAFGADATIHDRFSLEAHVRGVPMAGLAQEHRSQAMQDFYGLRWDGFEVVGQSRDDPIEVVAYRSTWPEEYERWRSRLASALGGVATRIDHIGSTAVPGLASKPIVDVQIGVGNLDDESTYVAKIETTGVSLRSRDAEHRYFRPPPARPRDVHVHVCAEGGDWQSDHLLFRDYLRAHPAERDAYAVLKIRLAEDFRDDRLGYTEGKSEFIRRLMRNAQEWTPGG